MGLMRKIIFLAILLLLVPGKISAQGNVEVDAAILPDANLLTFSLASDQEEELLTDSQEATFTVSFSSSLPNSLPFDIEVYWRQGVTNQGLFIDTLEYVNGSGTNTSQGISPIIDLQNNKITWPIASLSPNIKDKVSFKLKVKDNLATFEQLSVNIEGFMKFAKTTIHDDGLISQAKRTPTPTPTPATTLLTIIPTTTPSPVTPFNPEPTNTPTPIPSFEVEEPLAISSLEILEIGKTEAIFILNSTRNCTYVLSWGDNPKNLNNQSTEIENKKIHILNFPDLRANTRYYFKVKLFHEKGQTTMSDLLTFITPSLTSQIKIDQNNTYLHWNDIDLSQQEFIFATPKTPLGLQIPIIKGLEISKAILKIQNFNVLGVKTILEKPDLTSTYLIQKKPNLLSGFIPIPELIGKYKVSVELWDQHGEYIVETLDTMINNNQFLAYGTNDPIEKVELSILKNDKVFVTAISDQEGKFNIILPKGEYTLKASKNGYKTLETNFSLNNIDDLFPKIIMHREDLLKKFMIAFLILATVAALIIKKRKSEKINLDKTLSSKNKRQENSQKISH